jgi:hypothetical protein
MELQQASTQWISRSADERFLSLTDLQNHTSTIRQYSRGITVASNAFQAIPTGDGIHGLSIIDRAGSEYAPTHWSFGQLAALAKSPAGYLRTLPSPLAADCLNYGLQVSREIEDVGLLLAKSGNDTGIVRAATGAKYGRIWDADIVDCLVDRFGDGVSGDWTIPGEFGQKSPITKTNTTLYASDHDLWVFLADEQHKITIPNRRNNEPGELSRGFFIWNSEVGAATFGVAMFLFDYMCGNHIVWGAREYREIKIRHTAAAPERYIDEIMPALTAMSKSSTSTIDAAIKSAREARLGDKVEQFLATRFGANMVDRLKTVHLFEEQRPIETIWDATTAATALARGIKFTDERVALERLAGKVMAEASNFKPAPILELN